MGSDFVQQDLGSKRTGFAVSPGRYISSRLDLGLALGFALIVFIVFRVNDSGLLSLIRLVIMVGGGWWIFKNANRWTAKTVDFMPGGQFVASINGIELPNAELIDRDTILSLSVVNLDENKEFSAVAYLLQVNCNDSGGHPRWIAGGMDRQTANRLHAAVNLALALVAVNANSPLAERAGMKVGDLLLTEVTPNVYQLQRKTANGHELAAQPPNDHMQALEFAQNVAGATPLWYSKLGGRGEAPILVPKD